MEQYELAGNENTYLQLTTLQVFKMFIKAMFNRLLVGQFRYGLPNRRKGYHTHLDIECKAYHNTGNAEHLINIANYCVLEWTAPGHPKHHFNPAVESVTRTKE